MEMNELRKLAGLPLVESLLVDMKKVEASAKKLGLDEFKIHSDNTFSAIRNSKVGDNVFRTILWFTQKPVGKALKMHMTIDDRGTDKDDFSSSGFKIKSYTWGTGNDIVGAVEKRMVKALKDADAAIEKQMIQKK